MTDLIHICQTEGGKDRDLIHIHQGARAQRSNRERASEPNLLRLGKGFEVIYDLQVRTKHQIPR